MVVHGRTSPRSLRNLLDRNDCLVSMPFTSARATRSFALALAHAQALHPMQFSRAAFPPTATSSYNLRDFPYPLRLVLEKTW